MNASNIQTIEGGTTNEDVGETRARKDQLARVKYHVLRLRVGKELRRLDHNARHVDRPCPLSMVRGHFKDYSKNGLFGKHTGEKYSHVWFPSFVRGRKEDGVVLKDYQQTTEHAAC